MTLGKHLGDQQPSEEGVSIPILQMIRLSLLSQVTEKIGLNQDLYPDGSRATPTAHLNPLQLTWSAWCLPGHLQPPWATCRRDQTSGPW